MVSKSGTLARVPDWSREPVCAALTGRFSFSTANPGRWSLRSLAPGYDVLALQAAGEWR
ncbi:MAG: hypothetical protein Q4G68_14010 [Planctomycetia bacterium]|nr:hypothetical protein [Planctomycetia bacterium]